MAVLITGGTGFIGSHIAVELLDAGYEVVLADNFYNSRRDVADRVRQISQRDAALCECDVSKPEEVRALLRTHPVDAVIHCAGYKAVGESVSMPLQYYRNNLDCTITILEMMQEFGIMRFIFSSSATVYGSTAPVPYDESMPPGICTNPYGTTKLFSEQIILDTAASLPGFSAVLLRYFNPVGAHPSGRIGELPSGVPNNLMPYITQVAAGKREKLSVYGKDYPTPDGTGVRDYIHVCDLAAGHVAALAYCFAHTGAEVFNLGRGKGVSVLEMISAFEKASGVKIPYQIAPRRQGDIAESYASVEKAERELGWKAKYDVETMCRDSWQWEQTLIGG